MVVGEGFQREPPRNRSPLAVSFPRFFSAKRNGVAPQREKPSSCFRPRRSGRFSERAADSPLACAIRLPCPVASGGPLSLDAQRKRRKKTAKGNRVVARMNGRYPAFGQIPARFPGSSYSNRSVCFDLKRTFRRNLQAATNGSCAVFRRIRTRLRPH